MLIKIENKEYELDVNMDSFISTYRIYRRIIFENSKQLQHPMVGAGMRQVKHIGGPGKGQSRQPRNKYANRVVHVPNAVGGRKARHYPQIKTYKKLNKKIKKLVFKQLIYYILKYCKNVIENINVEKTKDFITYISQNNLLLNKKTKQSIIVISDSDKIYTVLKNIPGLLVFNILKNQEFYKIDINNIKNKTFLFTTSALKLLIDKYYSTTNDETL